MTRRPLSRKTTSSSQSSRRSLTMFPRGVERKTLSCNSLIGFPPARTLCRSSFDKWTFIMLQTGMSLRLTILLPSSLRTCKLSMIILSCSFSTPTGIPSVAARKAFATSLRPIPERMASCWIYSATRALPVGFQLFCTE